MVHRVHAGPVTLSASVAAANRRMSVVAADDNWIRLGASASRTAGLPSGAPLLAAVLGPRCRWAPTGHDCDEAVVAIASALVALMDWGEHGGAGERSQQDSGAVQCALRRRGRALVTASKPYHGRR